ncbi:MAG: hypothetical protein M3443_19345 [Actinomycetota bacterium]|nr:hypothetical protein [Actinomycetota bacterium]
MREFDQYLAGDPASAASCAAAMSARLNRFSGSPVNAPSVNAVVITVAPRPRTSSMAKYSQTRSPTSARSTPAPTAAGDLHTRRFPLH